VLVRSGLRLVCLLPVVPFELLWRIYGAVQADGGLFERMAALLQGLRQKRWLLTLVSERPARSEIKTLPPWSNRAGMRTIACMS